EHQPLGSLDLADQPLAPHFLAVGHAHAVVVGAAGAQVELGGDDAEALGTEPLLQALRLGPGLPHALAGGVELAADDKRIHASTITLKPPQKNRLPSKGIFFGSMELAMRLSFITFFITASRCLRFL